MRLLIILISLIFSFNLFSDPISRGRSIYEKSGIKKENQKQETQNNNSSSIDKETILSDAIDGKVLINYEYWDKNGKRHVGTCVIPQPENVKSGITYGANGTEFTGSFIGTLVTNNIYTNADFQILRTGQIMAVIAGDDGVYKKGFHGGYINPDQSWNGNTRFETNSDNTNTTVLDKATGLMWTRDANIYGQVNCPSAIDTYPTACIVGGYSDWRCPNKNELESLIDIERSNPALPTGHPFKNVQNGAYWTGSNKSQTTTEYFAVSFSFGQVYFITTATVNYVWFCRDN